MGGSWTCRNWKKAEVTSNRKEEELRNISTEHEEELQKVKVQLAAAKEKSLFSSAFSYEFYCKTILVMQGYYAMQARSSC